MSGFFQSRDVRVPRFHRSRSGLCGGARSGPPRRSGTQQAGLPQGRGRLRNLRFGPLALSFLDELNRLLEPLVLDDFSLLHAVLLREGRCQQVVLAVPEAQ